MNVRIVINAGGVNVRKLIDALIETVGHQTQDYEIDWEETGDGEENSEEADPGPV